MPAPTLHSSGSDFSVGQLLSYISPGREQKKLILMIQVMFQQMVETRRGQATKIKHLAACDRRLLSDGKASPFLLSIQQVIENCFLILTNRHCALPTFAQWCAVAYHPEDNTCHLLHLIPTRKGIC